MAATAVNANKLIIMCENDFLINNVVTLSSVTELNGLLKNTIEVAATDSLVKASRYALLNSDITVQFVNSRKSDALLFAIFD
jgi:acetylglutamate kinase